LGEKHRGQPDLERRAEPNQHALRHVTPHLITSNIVAVSGKEDGIIKFELNKSLRPEKEDAEKIGMEKDQGHSPM
jgi:hypothetical protein